MKTFNYIYNKSHWKFACENNRSNYKKIYPNAYQPTYLCPRFIIDSFRWGETSEGYDYWFKVYCFWVTLYLRNTSIVYEFI